MMKKLQRGVTYKYYLDQYQIHAQVNINTKQIHVHKIVVILVKVC